MTNPPCKHMKPEPFLCVAPAPTPRHRFVQRRMVVCECQNPSRDLCRPRQAQCRCANLELLSRLARCQGRTCSGPVQMRKTGNVVAIGTFERPVTGPPAIELAQEIPAGPWYCPVHHTCYLSLPSCKHCRVSFQCRLVSSQGGILAFQCSIVS